jgi:glycosyltransferase involved in cell wall biosynthesis
VEKIALVSVVMPVRNMEKTVGLAIESILAQTYSNIELLIMDDGSTDQTLAVVRRFSDSRIRLFSDSNRLGIAARLNQGIDMAEGAYLARMDADDLSLPNRIESQVAFLVQQPTIDLVGTAVTLINNRGKKVGEILFPTTHQLLVARPIRGFLIAHPTWVGRIEWFRKWKYRPSLRCEDQDLLLRAFSESQYANLPQPLLHYRKSSSFHLKKWVARLGWLMALIMYVRSSYSIRNNCRIIKSKRGNN